MSPKLFSTLGLALSLPIISASAFSISPLASFGGGDGWLAPGENGTAYLGTGSLERGMAFGNNHIYVVSRNAGTFIRMLDPLTGADVGGLNTTGISGGTFVVNTIGVGGDGAIYVNNLTTQSTTSPLRIYKWVSEAVAPSVVYSGDAGLAGSRAGDSLAVFGSGSSTRIAVGYGSTPVVAGNNGYAIIDPAAGTATRVGFAATPPNAGDFRLGLTFSDASHIWGSQGTTLRYTSFSDTTGTLLSSFNPSSTAERLMSFTELGGMSLLAVQSTGDSHVSFYDVSNPASPLLLASGNNTSGTLTANGNASGELAWGTATGNPDGTVSQTLYAMSSNQGIQAFVVTVPEPGTGSLLLLGLGALALRRRVRK
jgi:hypothetical protein